MMLKEIIEFESPSQINVPRTYKLYCNDWLFIYQRIEVEIEIGKKIQYNE